MMNRAWTDRSSNPRSPIDEILASKQDATPDEGTDFASRYGEGRREQREREQIRESYLAMDVRLKDGSLRGFFYYDLAGGPTLDATQTELTIPFRNATLVIHGHRLFDLYRAVLHHSLDVLEESHRPEFAAGEDPVIASIQIMEGEQ